MSLTRDARERTFLGMDSKPVPMETLAVRVPVKLKRRLFKMPKWKRQPFCEEALVEKFERVDAERRGKAKS